MYTYYKAQLNKKFLETKVKINVKKFLLCYIVIAIANDTSARFKTIIIRNLFVLQMGSYH